MRAQQEKKSENRTLTVAGFIEKIVVGVGVGKMSHAGNFTDKILPQVTRDLATLTGQQPDTRTARLSIAGFKVRQGQVVGLRVTLRGRKMADFFGRLMNIALPRVRDFRGIDLASIDGGGVLNLGIKEHIVFPEINPENSPTIFSMGIAIVPRERKKSRESVAAAYRELGVPLKKK